MSTANHHVARTQSPTRDVCVPFAAIRTAIENLSDEQVRVSSQHLSAASCTG